MSSSDDSRLSTTAVYLPILCLRLTRYRRYIFFFALFILRFCSLLQLQRCSGGQYTAAHMRNKVCTGKSSKRLVRMLFRRISCSRGKKTISFTKLAPSDDTVASKVACSSLIGSRGSRLRSNENSQNTNTVGWVLL